MFSSVNFKFSLSLAFITWIILCYMEMIGKPRPINDVNVELHTEPTPEESTRQQNVNPEEKSNELDRYLSFMWVFVCICVISKLGHYIERYITRQLIQQLHFISEPALSDRVQQRSVELLALPPPQMLLALPAPPPSPLPSEVELAPSKVVLPPTLQHEALPMPPSPPRLQQMRQPPPQDPAEANTADRQRVMDKLRHLEARCSKMQKFFDNLLDSVTTGPVGHPSPSTSRSHDVVPVAEKQLRVKPQTITTTRTTGPLPAFHTPLNTPPAPVTPTVQNVYIINSHLHLAGDIYVNQHNIKVNKPFITMPQSQARARLAPKPAIPALRSKADSEFRQIWSKFIQQPNGGSAIANVTRRNFLI